MASKKAVVVGALVGAGDRSDGVGDVVRIVEYTVAVPVRASVVVFGLPCAS